MGYDGVKIGDLFSESFFDENFYNSKALNTLYGVRLRVDLTPQDTNVKNTGNSDNSNVYEIVETNETSRDVSQIYNKAFKKNEVFNFSHVGIIINSVTGIGNSNKGVLGIKNNSSKAMYITDATYHAKLKNGNLKDGISAVAYIGLFGSFSNDGPLTQLPISIKRGATVEYDLNTDIEAFLTNDNNVVANIAFGAQQVNFNSTNQSVSAEGSIPEKIILTQPILVKSGTTIGILATNTTVFNDGVDIQASININGFFTDETDF